ncbi:MAG: T9SS type A sorting domain-containing protein [Candidatus Zixiibacteriota bacterium]
MKLTDHYDSPRLHTEHSKIRECFPGKHTVEWNGKDSASGVYFYRLTSGESTQTKKMILLK